MSDAIAEDEPDPATIVDRIKVCTTTGTEVNRLLRRPSAELTKGMKHLIGPVQSEGSGVRHLIVYVNQDDIVVDLYWNNLWQTPYTPADQCQTSPRR